MTEPGESDRPRRRLTRSRAHRMLSGVCGGLAEYFGVDVTLVRVVSVLISIVSAAFPGIFAYVVLTLLIPRAEPAGTIVTRGTGA